MPKKQRRTFTSEFKKQMVQLYENGKTRAAIVEIKGIQINTKKLVGIFKKESGYSADNHDKELRQVESNSPSSRRSRVGYSTS